MEWDKVETSYGEVYRATAGDFSAEIVDRTRRPEKETSVEIDVTHPRSATVLPYSTTIKFETDNLDEAKTLAEFLLRALAPTEGGS